MPEETRDQSNFDYLIKEGLLEKNADQRVGEDVIQKINQLPWGDVQRMVRIHREVGRLPTGVSQFI